MNTILGKLGHRKISTSNHRFHKVPLLSTIYNKIKVYDRGNNINNSYPYSTVIIVSKSELDEWNMDVDEKVIIV